MPAHSAEYCFGTLGSCVGLCLGMWLAIRTGDSPVEPVGRARWKPCTAGVIASLSKRGCCRHEFNSQVSGAFLADVALPMVSMPASFLTSSSTGSHVDDRRADAQAAMKQARVPVRSFRVPLQAARSQAERVNRRRASQKGPLPGLRIRRLGGHVRRCRQARKRSIQGDSF